MTEQSTTPQYKNISCPIGTTGRKGKTMGIFNMEKAIAELDTMFKAINKEYYKNELPTPIITVQSTPRAYGHCTRQKIWKGNKDDKYEINIGADTLAREREETVATLIHESVHLFCRVNNIKEVSGAYHNKTFKELAEQRTLNITCHDKYGWTVTKPTQKTKDFCTKYKLKKISINRGPLKDCKMKGDKKEKAKTSTRKYICPQCSNSLRTTKDLNIMCMDCMIQFVKVD